MLTESEPLEHLATKKKKKKKRSFLNSPADTLDSVYDEQRQAGIEEDESV